MNERTRSQVDMDEAERRNVADAARSAGLAPLVRPTMAQVDRRRGELFLLTIVLLVAFSVGMVVLSFADAPFARLGGSVNVVRAALVLLAVLFGAYILEKERRLRHVTHSLMNERVISTALMNRLHEISVLTEAGRAVTSTLELDEVLDLILDRAATLLGSDEGSLLLIHGDQMIVAAATGRTRYFVGERTDTGQGVAGYVARTHHPLLIQDEVDMAEIGLSGAARGRAPIRSSVCVPMEVQDAVVGVLCLNIMDGERRFEEYDLQVLQLFAQHAALAIHTSRTIGPDRELDHTTLIEIERLRADATSRVAEALLGTDPEPSADGAERRPSTDVSVLLVEDDPGLLRFLRVAFETEGYTVHLASDGRTAISRIHDASPDVVLLDLAIPVMDGWTVLEEARTSKSRPRVICVTGKDNRRDAIRAWSLGADEYIAKPFDLPDLLALAAEVAARTPQERAARRETALSSLHAATS